VAELVAEGLTNREIAERLFIGVRTAEYHVDQLRSKLGVRSRAQVAALWVQQARLEAAHGDGGVPAAPAVPAASVPASRPRRRLASYARLQKWKVMPSAGLAVLLVLVGGVLTWPRIQVVRPHPSIETFAGVGVGSFAGDGGPARRAALREPSGVAVGRDGAVYVAADGRVRRIGPDGMISTVAGTGTLGSSGDGGAAVLAQIGVAGRYGNTGMAVDPDGALYVPDIYGHRVRRIAPGGTITTIAGTGIAGDSGDGGPAVAAALIVPRGLAVDDRGDLFIADAGRHRVRRVDATGTITTLAGSGVSGSGGDGGPATAAQLDAPEALALDRSGNLFIADTGNNRVRRVALDGSITTVAGNGAFGFSGDGGKATAARLALPRGLVTDPRGLLYIADSDNNRVRRVDAAGTITTVAGTGAAGFSGDGGPATQARLDGPDGVALDGAGRLFIADAGNHRVRVVRT
jgi:sugar lactone lactonase YvrE